MRFNGKKVQFFNGETNKKWQLRKNCYLLINNILIVKLMRFNGKKVQFFNRYPKYTSIELCFRIQKLNKKNKIFDQASL